MRCNFPDWDGVPVATIVKAWLQLEAANQLQQCVIRLDSLALALPLRKREGVERSLQSADGLCAHTIDVRRRCAWGIPIDVGEMFRS